MVLAVLIRVLVSSVVVSPPHRNILCTTHLAHVSHPLVRSPMPRIYAYSVLTVYLIPLSPYTPSACLLDALVSRVFLAPLLL